MMQLGAVPAASLSAQRAELSAATTQATKPTQASSFDSALKTQVEKTQQPPAMRRAAVAKTVAIERTKLTSTEARDALRSAWTAHFGETPREETVAVLTAQWSHETGNGRSMLNFNFGGIKGTGPSGLNIAARTKEGWGATERTIVDNFRAYRTAEEGASDYLSLLRRKYPQAVEAAQKGDPESFVRELKAGGYFTGNESAYVRSVSVRTEQLLGHAPVGSKDELPEGLIDIAQPRSAPGALSPAQWRESPGTLDAGAGATHLSFADLHAAVREGTNSEIDHGPALASLANRPLIPTALLGEASDLGPLVDPQSLTDTLSRAALRIALSPGSREEEG